MAITFTTQVLRYCLGAGTLQLRGARARLWLEIKRPEHQLVYLRHQSRVLRQALGGVSCDHLIDVIPGKTLTKEGTARLRLRADELWPAFELLYQADEKRITAGVLSLCGFPGLASVFIDRGVRRPASAQLGIGTSPWPDTGEIDFWLRAAGHPGKISGGNSARRIRWGRLEADALIEAIRAIAHPSVRSRLYRPRRPEWVRRQVVRLP